MNNFSIFSICILTNIFNINCDRQQKMTLKKEKSVPVGRLLIDVPHKVEITWGRQSCRMLGAFIQTFPSNPGEELLSFAKEGISNGGLINEPESTRTEFIKSKVNGSFIAISSNNESDSRYSTNIHGFFSKNGRGFLFHNVSQPEKENINKRTEKFEREFSNLQIRDELEIPTIPGFCFDHAFFPDPAPPGNSEHASIHFSFPDHPDVFIRFSSDVVNEAVSKGTPLLERHGSLSRGLEAIVTGVRDLRARNRQVGPFAGQELITRVRERNLKIGYSFTWEYMGEGEDVLRPMMLLEMVTGHGRPPVQSSLSLKEATALWDGVLESIRLRVPTATFK